MNGKLFFLLCLASTCLTSGCLAEDSALPPTLQQTWTAFQTAVRSDDTEALARVSGFPIRANDFGGKIPNATVLKQRFPRIFSDAIKRCVAEKAPQRIPGFPGYLVDCNNENLAIGLGFESAQGSYRFTYIDNANAE